MTYSYQLIVGGEQRGPSLSSSDEVRSALHRYIADHPDEVHGGRLLVGRLLSDRPESPGHGGGIYRADAFLENAQNPDPDEEFWHRRIRDLLNSRLRERLFFLWLSVAAGSGRSRLDESVFISAVEHWLTWLAPRVYEANAANVENLERVEFPQPEGGWSWQGKEFEWRSGDLQLRLTAIPRRREVLNEPANEVIGNPEPAFAFYG